jgi:hypothetical protein
MSETAPSSQGSRAKRTLQGLKHAVGMGRRGDFYTEEHKPTKAQRAARAVVSAVVGNPSRKAAERMDREWNENKMRIFNAATESAKGMNREVVALLREAAEMPGSTISDPLSTSHILEFGPGKSRVHWARSFSRNGSDPSRMFGGSVPLQPVPGRNLEVTVDSADWAQNAIRTPVNTVEIQYHAPATLGGDRRTSRVDEVLPGSTTIRINPWQGEPRYDRMYTDSPGMPAEINRDSSPDGEMDIVIGPDGNVSRVRVGRNNRVTPADVPNPQIDVAGLLQGLREEIFVTNHNNMVPNDLSGLAAAGGPPAPAS